MRTISKVIAMVLALTMLMSVSAFAAPVFGVTGELPAGITALEADADSIDVTATATSGKYYGVLLVKGDELPTVDSDILYIDQKTAAAATVAFEVLPIIPDEEGVVTLYVSSNVDGAGLITVPMTYATAAPAGYPKGDVNNDGYWNSSDALTALQIGSGAYAPTVVEETAADVNEDGFWNSTDALMILQYGSGSIDSWD